MMTTLFRGVMFVAKKLWVVCSGNTRVGEEACVLLLPLVRRLAEGIRRQHGLVIALDFPCYTSRLRASPTHGDDVLNIQLRHTRDCNGLLPLRLVWNALLLCALGKNLPITLPFISNGFDFYRMKPRGKHALLPRILHGRQIL